MLKIEHNFGDLINVSSDIEKRQIPFALSLAINKTAEITKRQEEHEMRDVFDRPTPYTLSSIFIKRSNKRNLTAIVGLKDFSLKAVPASKFLTPQIAGGGRRLKRFEVALRSVGVLPDDYFTVPGQAAKMDAYGNMSKGQIVQILSYFSAFGQAGFRANSTDKTRARLRRGSKKTIQGLEYFAIQPGESDLHPGVYMRVFSNFGVAIRPVLIFVKSVLYDPIFDFAYVAEIANRKYFGIEFRKALRYAVSTSRKK